MESKRGKKLGLVGIIALTLGLGATAPACYMENGLYFRGSASMPYSGKRRPRPEDRDRRQPVQWQQYPAPVTVEECQAHTYAATAGESMKTRGKRTVTVESCRPMHDPHNTYTNGIYFR